MRSIVVAGASLAGLRCAEALRREGFDGRLTLVGEEAEPPYTRPPLSKDLLIGAWDPASVALSTPDELDALDVVLRLGAPASSLDLEGRVLHLAGGEEERFDGLVIATGARARRLPGTEGIAAVSTLRDLGDAARIREALDAGPRRVAVVGGGFIGAEVAAAARERDLDVTMVEMASVPFLHALGAELGAVLADHHRRRGVELRLGTGVERIASSARGASLALSDGSTLDADLVVVGIGAMPNIEWLKGSGLELDDGVVCDERLIAAPGVVAAGDVARWPNPVFGGTSMRIEHWDNAVQQGAHAAESLLRGRDATAFAAVPWFWSDQFDLAIQLAGRIGGHHDLEIVAREDDDRRLLALIGEEGRLSGVFGINRGRDVMRFRRHIAEGIGWEDALAEAR